MPVSERTYELVALEDPEGNWELHRGRLREKPSMSYRHNRGMMYLGIQLGQQLDPREFEVRVNAGRVRRANDTAYIPDVLVIPVSMIGPDKDRPDVLERYDGPLPLVVEVWSPSTGGYDVDEKIPEYCLRGDLEIWRLHPFERTLTIWRRQPDGSYDRTVVLGGRVSLMALPGATVDLDALWV
ncbi:MAG: hypothetical protein AVDCRST_MAG73-1598 [uncultured Thermomicrobiales bacterium]|uniref:Putative restriction endonuclease domain-containing protein n=1 Tax=uncultured Thermomicrobiales bacterium TaxID=1645740 RepID=A0A6J4U1X6_9BACT|nr:MAG: hypothetical protein AVDCRST_MAG73-1598 [uncultured Thermomicrobiales bacterium]